MADRLQAPPPSRFRPLGESVNLPGKQIYFMKKAASGAVTPIELDSVDTSLWFDASDLSSYTRDSGSVTNWTSIDSDLNALTVAEISTDRPKYNTVDINGIDVIDGDDISAFLVASSPSLGTAADHFHTGGELWAVFQARTDGEADLGTIYRVDGTPTNNGNSLTTLNESGSNIDIRFHVSHSTQVGQWTITTTLNEPHLIHIIYDASDNNNDPIIEVDGVSLTVTEVSEPIGTVVDDSTGSFYLLTVNGVRQFDGSLAEFAFTPILSVSQRTGLTNGLMAKWGIS